MSSNLATPTNRSLEKSRLFSKVRQKGKKSAPSIYELEFEVEEPNSNENTEMAHQVITKDCSGDLSKRWHVEYYIINPETKKRERKRDYGYINKYKTADERYTALKELKAKVIETLDGEISNKTAFKYSGSDSITYYMNEYLRVKRPTLERESNKLYTGSLKCFHNFLKEKNLSHVQPHFITKQLAVEFINKQTKTLSNRSVNNHMEFVKGFFNYLNENYDNVILKNPFSKIVKLPSKSETHVAYSKKQAQEIGEYLSVHDPNLLLYCRFIAYGFLRCKETRNLKIGDIDMDNRTITLSAKSAKTKKRVVKPMLDTLYNYLLDLDLHKFQPNNYVFTINGLPGPKPTYGNFFQKRYKKVKKHFGLSELYTIYSFRHTFVCDLLNSGANWHEIMKYTGHTTFAAFEKYARSLINKPAVDLSTNISINF